MSAAMKAQGASPLPAGAAASDTAGTVAAGTVADAADGGAADGGAADGGATDADRSGARAGCRLEDRVGLPRRRATRRRLIELLRRNG